jgi:hypothetical protein
LNKKGYKYMLPAQVGPGADGGLLLRDRSSTEIQFARIGDIDMNVFADAAGLAALGPRLPDTVDERDSIILDLDVDLLSLSKDNGRNLEQIGTVGDYTEMCRVEGIEELERFFCPPYIFHGTLFNGADIRLGGGDDICDLLLSQPLLSVPEHFHLAIGEQPILHAILF